MNNTISESGADAVFFQYCNNIKYEGNKITNTNNMALRFELCKNILANNNEIHNTGMRAGMGTSYNCVNILYQIRNCLFEKNIIDSIGFNGIHFEGDSVFIKNNVLTNFCMTLDDGAGLYTSGDGILVHNQRELQKNIILNGIGANEGTDSPVYRAAEGIYMDDRTFNVTISNNTVSNCTRGIFVHNSNSISVIGNTLYNNDTQTLFRHDNIAPDYPVSNCSVNNNIFFSKSYSQGVADFKTIDNAISNFGTFDNNYYCRPIDDDATIYTEYTGNNGNISKLIDLATWQSTFNKDPGSRKSPYEVPAYKITNLISPNKYTNGQFNSNISGWTSWSNYNNGYVSWDNTNKLDGGSLKLGFSSSAGKTDAMSVALGSFGEIVAGEKFILRFSMVASSQGTPVGIYMETYRDPYKLLTPYQYVTAGTNRKEFELLFTPDSSNPYSRIDFQIKNDDGPVWIDNIELYKANIVSTDIDDYVKFIYNEIDQPNNYNLNKSYIDVKGNKYSGNITLLPFTSAVLMLDPDSDTLSAVPSDHKEQPFKIYPNPAKDYLNILMGKPAMKPDFIEITNFSGKVFLLEKVNPPEGEFKIHINLSNGFYFVRLKSGGRTLFSQKLIIVN